MNRRESLKCGLLAACMLAHPASVLAAQPAYPSRPVSMVVPFPPGGATDLVARIVSRQLGQQLGQTIVVDNRAGANTVIGMRAVVRAAADGYTLLYNTASLTLAPSLTTLNFDPIEEFVPITATVSIPLVLLAHPSVPGDTVEAFVAHARSQSAAPMSYASSSAGSVTHLAAVMFARDLGFEATHVPYRGTAPALQDLVGGQVQFMINTLNDSLPFIREGRVKALAIASKTRSPLLPDVPTVSESVIPGFEASAWQGMVAPAGTPAEIIDRLAAETRRALEQPEVLAHLSEIGAVVMPESGADYGRMIRAEHARWRDLIQQIGLKQGE